MEVMYDGSVVLCCDDSTGSMVLGNVFKQTIDQIWNGSVKEAHRNLYSETLNAPKICVGCDAAVTQKSSHKGPAHCFTTRFGENPVANPHNWLLVK